jgi:murein DD-endopeptidase MepM/ murein hydrolase activator NlpD
MPDDFYTLIVVPSDGASVRKLSLSAKSLLRLAASVGVVLLVVGYLAYDYIDIQREKFELSRLRQQTKEQKAQIEGLVAKVDQFNSKMEELRQIDKKIRIIANLENRKDREQLLGIGGPGDTESRMNARLSNDSKALIESIDKNVEQLSQDASKQEKSFTELLEFLRKQKSIMASTPSVWPVMGWITSEFGTRISPFTSSREFHAGIDIATRVGNPVKAPADGVVAEAGYQSSMGNSIRIEHGHGLSTWYGHLSRIAVSPGSSVKRGDVIGYVGTSGRSTGSHLHYGVYINNVAVNPRRYLN